MQLNIFLTYKLDLYQAAQMHNSRLVNNIWQLLVLVLSPL